jgi:hypothetical protein
MKGDEVWISGQQICHCWQLLLLLPPFLLFFRLLLLLLT